MKSTRDILSAMDQIEELLRSVSLTPQQRDHYERELDELNTRFHELTATSSGQSD